MTPPESLRASPPASKPVWPSLAQTTAGTDSAGSGNGARRDTPKLPLVLLVDDDATWRGELARYLRSNGFDSAEFCDFAALLAFLHATDGRFIIVAELTAGARHLFDCLAEMARHGGSTVLVLSNQNDETETIVALELGADDVIRKVTERREVLARIRAGARRVQWRLPANRETPNAPVPPAGGPGTGWQFQPERRELTDPRGRQVLLTAAEFKLLEAFVANTGRALPRRELSSAVLGREYGGTDRGIDNLVAKLRRKLRDPAKQPQMIKTARPLGYVFIGFRAEHERPISPDSLANSAAPPRSALPLR